MDNLLITKGISIGIKDTSPQQIKLSDVRSVFLEGRLTEENLGILLKTYLLWLNENVYLCLRDRLTGNYHFIKANKRGNDIYTWKTEQRLLKATSFIDDKFCKKFAVRRNGRNLISNILFITLTANPNYFFNNRIPAWKSVQADYNRFITAFRKRYGKCWVLRNTESFSNGYPHIHLLVICENPFNVFLYNGKFRASEKPNMENLWYANIDVQAPYSDIEVRNYLIEDVIKQANIKPNAELCQENLSLCLNWLFRKKSFSVSGHDLIILMTNSNSEKEKICLDLYEKADFEFIGIVKFHFSTPPPHIFTISEEEIEKNDKFYYVRQLIK